MKRVLLVTSAFLACLLGAWQSAFGGSPNPYMWISKVTIDTVSLTTPSRVTVEVAGGSRGGLTDVSAWIDTGQGYRISSQPAVRTDTLRRGSTFSFVGVIQATAKGTWHVQVEAKGMLRDGTIGTGKDGLYILLSDTLDRAMTGAEYILLQSPYGKTTWRPKPDKVIQGRPGPVAKPGHHGSVGDTCSTIPKAAKVIDTTRSKKAKPAPADSSTKKDSTTKKVSGTFDVTGYLSYHDPRDPQGWLKPARNVDVEVWNDGQYDTPPSADVLLATGITDWYGCYSFWWLDNSDGDGTADPFIIWRSDNSVWEVRRPSGGDIYKWYSQVIQNVEDNSTVDFGDHPIESYPGAMWCFQYMNEGWGVAEDVGPHPGFVSCIWPIVGTYDFHLNGSIYMTELDADAIDLVNHEYAHALMYQKYGASWPVACNPDSQYINYAYCESFGWTEGWAYFFPLVVTNDHTYDYELSTGSHCNLEIPPTGLDSLDWGPGCPGRVAGALLDLWDTNNDGLDQNSAHTVSFETLYTWGIQSHRDSTFYQYWSYLRNNELNTQQIALGLKSIANNTIHFDCTFCGDANNDGSVDISDVVFLIAYIFSTGRAPGDCNYAKGRGDANGDGRADISDVVYLIARVFSGGKAPHCQGMAQLTHCLEDGGWVHFPASGVPTVLS
jgi:hypothetical protein